GQRQRDRADVPLDPSSPGDTTNEDGVEIGWKGGVAGTTPNTNQWGESLADKRETAGRTSGISSVEGS
ncbi:MAG TPA: hypothetical protein VFW40_13105, partial [Capsulimonadaceae bacterium]|nr:hypothetical protein [Capsulimonadaceae bacterium]